ncbi:hypothetical protein IJ182_11155 [bacterium]|nr:hypothetical protein [bacterium]
MSKVNGVGQNTDIERLNSKKVDLSYQKKTYNNEKAVKQQELEFASMTVGSLIESSYDDDTDDMMLQSNVDAAQGEVDAAQGEVDAAQNNVDTAQGEVDTAQGEVDAAQGEVDMATNDLGPAKAELASAKIELGAAHSLPDTITETVNGKKQQKPNPKKASAIAAAEKKVREAQAKVDAAQARLDAANTKLAAANGELDTAKGNLTSSQNELTTKETELSTAQAAYDEAKAELDARQQEDEAAIGTNETEDEQEVVMQEAEEEIAELDEQIEETDAEIAEVDREISEAEAEQQAEGSEEQNAADNPLSAAYLIANEGNNETEGPNEAAINYASNLEQNIQAAIDGTDSNAMDFLKAEAETLSQYTGDDPTILACKELVDTAIETAEDAQKAAEAKAAKEAMLEEAKQNEDHTELDGNMLIHYDAQGNKLYSETVSEEEAKVYATNGQFDSTTPINGNTLNLNEYWENRGDMTKDEEYFNSVAQSITDNLAEKYGIKATADNGNYTVEMESVYQQIYENNKEIFTQSGYDLGDKPSVAEISNALAHFSWDGDKSLDGKTKVKNDNIDLSGITPKASDVTLYDEKGLPTLGASEVTQRHTIDELNDLKTKLYESIGVFEIGKIPDSMIVTQANQYYDQLGLAETGMSREVFQQAFEGYNTQIKYQNAALDFLDQADSSTLSKLQPNINSNSDVYKQNDSNPIWQYYRDNLQDSGIDYNNFVLSCVAYSHVNSGGQELRNGAVSNSRSGHDNNTTVDLENSRYLGIFDTDNKKYTLIDFNSNPPTRKEPLDMVLGSGTNTSKSDTLGEANTWGSGSTLSGYELVSYSYDNGNRYSRYVFGLEYGKNDQAYNKETVIHPTGYNTSLGCPAYRVPNYDSHRRTTDNMDVLNTYFPRGTIMYTTPPQSVRDEYQASTEMIDFEKYRRV